MLPFTVRITRGRTREVYACARYFVAFGVDGTAVLTLVGMPSETPGDTSERPPQAFLLNLAADECAFVMNDKGITCDAVRARPQEAKRA